MTPYGPDQGYLQAERELGTPLIFVDRMPYGIVADGVLTDNSAWAEAATQHLIDRGHRRIAFLGDDLGIPTARERLSGHQRAMAKAGLVASDDLTIGDLTSSDLAADWLDRLLDRPDAPTALVTGQNLITIGALRRLHRRVRQHEVALVGFDDISLTDLLQPGSP